MLLVGAALLPVAVLVSPVPAPPLYDGVGSPDEPYRHTAPAPGAPRTDRPTAATTPVVLAGGRSAPLEVATAEQGPQAALRLPAGALVGPPGARLVVAVAPVDLPVPPPNGAALSNGYRVEAVDAAGAQVPLAERRTASVDLRIPAATNAAVALELYDGATWFTLPTSRAGFDVYRAELPVLGVVAAVRITDRSGSRAYAAQGRSRSPGLVLVGVVVLVAAAVALLARRTGARRRAEERDPQPEQEPPARGSGQDGLGHG